ncbi:lysophospholipid acyltransferase family protein [Sneathiella limimaris]|uniref:lysophospholipid acyltransferase family protein n=1 Tax=Sneathiella limimaris TaxID=1964213 RepID=UPI00146C0C0A|nr:lysophospholipid acyltransferase family protein [Sneathiella limimaris]
MSVITRLAAAYIWFVHKSVRWKVINGEIPNQYMKEGKPFLMAFWHGRLFLMAELIPSYARLTVMISQHGDGELIARTVKYLGVDSIRGSSSKGGVPALKEMLKLLKRNRIAVITPDGPRGPRMHAQDGVVGIAAMSGVPVIPVSFATTRTKHLSSWDRFALAAPFGKGVLVWGDPIYVPRKDENGSFELAKKQIEDSLNFVTQESDRLCGLTPVEPASIEKQEERVVS